MSSGISSAMVFESIEPPFGFTYVNEQELARLVPSKSRRVLDLTGSAPAMYIVTSSGSSDLAKINKYVFDGETGKLTVHIKNDCRFHFVGREFDPSQSGAAINALDAVLTKLAISIFKFPVNETGEIKTLALLQGNCSPRLKLTDSIQWENRSYDPEGTRPIDFDAINGYAFDLATYSLNAPKENSFSITLNAEYKDHPGVLYALHNILGTICGFRREEQNPN